MKPFTKEQFGPIEDAFILLASRINIDPDARFEFSRLMTDARALLVNDSEPEKVETTLSDNTATYNPKVHFLVPYMWNEKQYVQTINLMCIQNNTSLADVLATVFGNK